MPESPADFIGVHQDQWRLLGCRAQPSNQLLRDWLPTSVAVSAVDPPARRPLRQLALPRSGVLKPRRSDATQCMSNTAGRDGITSMVAKAQ